jgi:hypothetical protein
MFIMTRSLLRTAGTFLLLTAFINTQAQDNYSQVHIGLCYPLSTNGQYAGSYTNKFSFHAVSGVSRSETGFCFAGVSNVIRRQADGFVFGGMVNHVGGNTRGMQFAGVVNHSGGSVTGVQFAGLTNIAGAIHGAQIAGFANVSKDTVTGSQLAGFCNTAVQAGSQLAGFCNVAKGTEGAQLAGFVNVSKHTRGAQLAGFANIAKDVDGAQIAGFINVARRVKGAQVAGLINIADSSEYPIGLINIIRYKGEQTIGASIDETGTLWGSFRSGSSRLYGIIGIGHNTGNQRLRYGLEGGIGAHFQLGWFFRLNTEATVLTWTDFERGAYIRSSLRVFPSMRMGRNLEIFAGPTFNCSGYSNRSSGDPGLRYNWNKGSGDIFDGINVGALAGLQVHL